MVLDRVWIILQNVVTSIKNNVEEKKFHVSHIAFEQFYFVKINKIEKEKIF
jgi:hypothetical protein